MRPPAELNAGSPPEYGYALRIVGPQAPDRSMVSVSGGGDFNGDGYDDVVVGARGYDNSADGNSGSGDINAGRAYVIFGRGDRTAGMGDAFHGYQSDPGQPRTLDLRDLESSEGIWVQGRAEGDALGASVDMGDVNGDGLADIVVGIPAAFENSPGGAVVVYGRRCGGGSGIACENLDLNCTYASIHCLDDRGFLLRGDNGTYGAAGSSVALGNVDGRGGDDIVIGDPRHGAYRLVGGSWQMTAAPGTAWVVFDSAIPKRTAGGATPSGGVEMALSSVVAGSGRGFAVRSSDDANELGASVDAGPDVNGDGLGDIAIGAPDGGPLPTTYRANGAGYIVFGRASDAPLSVTANSAGHIPGAVRVLDTGPGDDHFTGSSAAIVGDVNGDGLSDYSFGSSNSASSSSGSGAGAAYVLYGQRQEPSQTATRNVAIGPDIPGGGYTIIGAQGYSSITSLPVWGDIGADAPDKLGATVAAIGDINHDGFADVGVTSPRANTGIPFNELLVGDNGSALLTFGGRDSAGLTLSGTIDLREPGTQQFYHHVDGAWGRGAGHGDGDQLGGSFDDVSSSRGLASAGDVNADGEPDVVAVAPMADTGSRENAGMAYIVFGPNPRPIKADTLDPGSAAEPGGDPDPGGGPGETGDAAARCASASAATARGKPVRLGRGLRARIVGPRSARVGRGRIQYALVATTARATRTMASRVKRVTFTLKRGRTTRTRDRRAPFAVLVRTRGRAGTATLTAKLKLRDGRTKKARIKIRFLGGCR
jgi:hypothetical protein